MLEGYCSQRLHAMMFRGRAPHYAGRCGCPTDTATMGKKPSHSTVSTPFYLSSLLVQAGELVATGLSTRSACWIWHQVKRHNNGADLTSVDMHLSKTEQVLDILLWHMAGSPKLWNLAKPLAGTRSPGAGIIAMRNPTSASLASASTAITSCDCKLQHARNCCSSSGWRCQQS